MTKKTVSTATNDASFGFGARLKAAREKIGMSGTELGKGAGERGKDASKASVSDWEHDRHYPKADQLRVICLKLNISVDELIFGDVQEQANLIFAESAIKALTLEQRMALLAKMMGPAVSDEHVEKHLPAPPPIKSTKRGAFLAAEEAESRKRRNKGH